MKTLYSTEEYALTKWLRYLIAAIFAVIAVLVIASNYVDFDASWFHKPNLAGTIVGVILCIILILLALYLKVRVEVDASEVRVKCIRTRTIKKKEIENVAIKDVDPIKEYGGYGYRMKKGERAIITGGTKRGVYIAVKEQPNLFVSTNEPERLVRAIKGQK